MAKILYLEDEHYLGRIVKESLASRGYNIELVSDGADLIRAYEIFKPDICVLDIMIPNIDGLTLGKQIREKHPEMPIIFLTAKNQTKDVLAGFQAGGNDYIKKPFSMEELMVRIDNLLHLKKQEDGKKAPTEFQLGQYQFNHKLFQLKYKDSIIQLSHRENELILMLATHVNKQLDRREILKGIWGDDSIYNSRNLDVYIRKLRVYFEHDPNIQLITLRGVGYHFSIQA